MESFVESINGRWITTVVVAQMSDVNRAVKQVARSAGFALQWVCRAV